MVDADGFQVVKKRKGFKSKFCQDNHRTSAKTWSKLSSSEIVHFDVNELKSKIDNCRHEKVSFFHCNSVVEPRICHTQISIFDEFFFLVMVLYTGMKF